MRRAGDLGVADRAGSGRAMPGRTSRCLSPLTSRAASADVGRRRSVVSRTPLARPISPIGGVTPTGMSLCSRQDALRPAQAARRGDSQELLAIQLLWRHRRGDRGLGLLVDLLLDGYVSRCLQLRHGDRVLVRHTASIAHRAQAISEFDGRLAELLVAAAELHGLAGNHAAGISLCRQAVADGGPLRVDSRAELAALFLQTTTGPALSWRSCGRPGPAIPTS